MSASEETFALIVGGGPVGLSLAVDLGARKVPAILVNDNVETAVVPKCNSVTARTMEHYRRLGMAKDVRASGISADFPMAVAFRTRYCEYELGRIDLTLLRKIGEWPGPEAPHAINQLLLEPIIKRHAEAVETVDVRFGQRAVALEFDESGVVATIEDLARKGAYKIRARYVVGCDGARSLVRSSIGANFIGEDGSAQRQFVSGTMISFFIRSPDLYAISRAPPALLTWIVNHDARGFVFSQNGRDRFLVHYQVPDGVDWRSVRDDDVLPRLLGQNAEYEVLYRGPWTGGLALVADKYAERSAFIAGDAAHLFTPLGGLGMNTGVGDAINLGWKLAAMHQGWGGPGLLQSYDPERRPIGYRNSRIGIHCADRKDKWRIPETIEDDTPEAEATRKTFGDFLAVDDADEYATIGVQLGERYASDIIVPPEQAPTSDPWDRYEPTDAAGGRAPHFALPDGGSIYDALGSNFGIIVFGAADAASIVEAAKARGVPLTTVKVAVRDPQYQHDLVLVRPDGHIAWSASAPPSDALWLIDKVRGAGA